MKVLAQQMPQRFRERIEARRASLEQARSTSFKRLHEDVKRIVRRETDYAKQVLEEIVPIRVTVDEAAMDRIKDFVPFRVEVRDTHKTSKPPTVEPEVMP